MNSLLTIKELAAKQFGGDAESVDADVPIDQLGIDSLGFIEFLFELEDLVAFPIPQQAVTGVKTLRELATVIDGLEAAAKPPATA